MRITKLPKATMTKEDDITLIVQDGETRQIPRTLLAPPVTETHTATCIDVERYRDAKFKVGEKSWNIIESYATHAGSTAKAHILLLKTAVVPMDGVNTAFAVLSGLPETADGGIITFRPCDRIRVFLDVQFEEDEPITLSLEQFIQFMEYNFSAKGSSKIDMNDMTVGIYFDIEMCFEMDTQAEAKEFADAFSAEFMQAFKKIWIYTDSAEYQTHESEVKTNAESV